MIIEPKNIKYVLFISPLPPPHGGIASWTKRLSENGLPRDYAPIIVDTSLGGGRKVFEKARLDLQELRRTFAIIKDLVHKLKSSKPVIIHLNCCLSSLGIFRDLFCAIIAKAFGVPLVTHYRGNFPDFLHKRFFGIAGLGLRTLAILSNSNIVLNKASYTDLQCLMPPFKKSTVQLLPNCIDDNVFLQHALKPMNTGKRKVLFVGGITTAKGCCELLRVARDLTTIEFNLIGEVKKDMETAIDNRPDNVKLLGSLDGQSVLNEMSRHDILFFPSHSEGFPNVVLEAMSVGMPVVATKVGAIPEMVQDNKGGVLVEKGDTDAMKTAIIYLLSNADKRMGMGLYNKEYAKQHYSYSHVMNQLVHIYEMCVKNI